VFAEARREDALASEVFVLTREMLLSSLSCRGRPCQSSDVRAAKSVSSETEVRWLSDCTVSSEAFAFGTFAIYIYSHAISPSRVRLSDTEKRGSVLHFFVSYIRFLSESSAILIYTSDIAFESTSLLFRQGMCARMAVTLRSIPSREVLDPPFRTTTTTGIRCKRCFVALAKFLRDIILRAAAARFGSVADTEEHFTRNACTRNVLFRG